MKQNRFERAHQIRQAILDLYHGRDWFSHHEAAKAIGEGLPIVYRACKAMVRDGEMEERGKFANMRFLAVSDKTMSVSDMEERAANKTSKTMIGDEPPKPRRGGIVHMSGDQNGGRPLPNQGGQWSVGFLTTSGMYGGVW